MDGAPRRPSTLWVVGMVLGGLLVLSQVVLPADSPPSDAAYVAGALGATAVIVVAAWRMASPLRVVWACFAGFAALWLAGDLLYLAIERIGGEAAFPGWPDAFYLSSYTCAVIGLVVLVRRLYPGRNLDAWIDASIQALAATALLSVTVLVPMVTRLPAFDATAVLTLAYPVADLVILAVLLRIAVGGGRLSPSTSLVVAAFAAVFVADLLYNVDVVYDGSATVTALSDASFLAGYVLLAGSATLPSSTELGGQPRSLAGSSSRLRTPLLTIGVLTIPVITMLLVWPDGEVVERLLAVLTVAVILLAVVRLRRLLLVVERQSAQLALQARTDPLTGLPNRRTLDHELDRAVRTARSAGTPLIVAMLDLDHFKAYNDLAGHQAGDHLLQSAARAWSALIPEGAFLARYGGEEFALILPGQEAPGARDLLDRLRRAMPSECSVSIGFAQLVDGETGLAALNRADRALYAAKAAGRDRVVSAEDADSAG
jgi:diguanylate cyclase (GGDEF)-like protein